MAKREKTTRFSIQGYDLNHYRTTQQYAAMVQALFDRATLAIAKAAARGKIDPDKPFSFDDYPEVKAELQKATGQLASNLKVTIETGSKKQWLFACQKNDAFLESIIDTSKLSKARLKKLQDRNLDALSAFQTRKVSGMDLSQRVWRYVGQFKDQIECALDVGLGDGRSAQQLARDVKQNLKEPDRLFRRVRDKRGNLVLSKAARAYHPGQGVYRSSVKNAQRLTRSEINMAYRESDFLRWQQLDFVVGFEIHRSNHRPLCKCKMCDRLQGRYPKTFKFKGWHPQCMCYAIPILADEETFDENELGDLKAALRGTEYKKKQSKNLVTDVPDGFKEWVAENMEASANWSSTPYFIKDNFVDGDLSKGLKIDLPQPDIDPIQEQLDALMPLIASARKIADEWGLENRLKGLDRAVAARDINDINKFINLITTDGTKYAAAMTAWVKEAGQVIQEMKAAGGGAFTTEIAELSQYITNLSGDKTMWVDGASFYESELARAKEKLRQYKASPEASMTASQRSLLADARETLRKANEWGIKTDKLRDLIDQFIAHPNFDWRTQPDSENYERFLENEYFAVDGKIDAAERKVDEILSDANALMKDARDLGVDYSEVSKHHFALSGRDKAYYWANYKRDINKAIKDLQDAVDEAKKKKQEEEAAKPKLETVIENVKKWNVDYLEVKKHDKQPTIDEIVERVAGGDKTAGSCSSLAFTFAANNAGLDVLDFRDGESRRYFSRTGHIREICEKVGGVNQYDVSGIEMMKTTTIGKMYYLAIGQHAAIVRQVSKGKYEYLELQSSYSNGWKPLNATMFGKRFGARGRCYSAQLIDIDLFKGDSSFKTLMGYINTSKDKQNKGASGTIK